MIALDTETTGVDFHHGARPFFLTTCSDAGDVEFFEWRVDPFTREVDVPAEDVTWVNNLLAVTKNWGERFDSEIAERHVLVLQNPKFDAAALRSIGVEDWPWEMTRDTLMAGHLLASNAPHDLYSMAVQYLGKSYRKYEERLEEIVKHARRLCRRKKFVEAHGQWAIADHDRPDMPSCPKSKKGKADRGDERDVSWKFDSWLPREVYLRLGPDKLEKWIETDPTPWESVLREYANRDSEITVRLWAVMKKLIRVKGLWAIYRERLKVLPVAFEMEWRGVTVSAPRLESQITEYRQGSADAASLCLNIAREMGETELTLPAGGVNKKLREFMLGTLALEPVYDAKAKTDAPTLNKDALQYYLLTLPPASPARAFVKGLSEKRVRDTASAYLESYKRFWLRDPDDPHARILHPRLNPTGTDTLRWSHENPNAANISKKDDFNLRRSFGPKRGREWCSFDAKNIEARLPAYESGERELIDLYERPDDPPYYGSAHLLNFHTVYPDLWEKEEKQVGPEKVGPHCKKKYAATWYQYCKNGGFAVQYGAVLKTGTMGTADRAFHKEGAHALLKERFSKLEDLNQKYIRFANKYGYVETLPDRSVDPSRGYPIICTRTGRGRVLETVPLNYHVQGSAMWWTMKAMIRVGAFFAFLNDGGEFAGKTWPGGYYIVMQVHDELVTDAPSGAGKGVNPWDYNLPVYREVQRLMALGGDDFNIPTPVGLEYHAVSWDQGVTL